MAVDPPTGGCEEEGEEATLNQEINPTGDYKDNDEEEEDRIAPQMQTANHRENGEERYRVSSKQNRDDHHEMHRTIYLQLTDQSPPPALPPPPLPWWRRYILLRLPRRRRARVRRGSHSGRTPEP